MQSVLYRQEQYDVAFADDQSLSPAWFYPVVTDEESEIWKHWLPTSFKFCRGPLACEDLRSKLSELDAPPEVMAEFSINRSLGLFDEYEIRTPVRTDARDPLLLGRVDGTCYRIALWGESLFPLERITELVQQSLKIRSEAELKDKIWHRVFATSVVGFYLTAFSTIWIDEGLSMLLFLMSLLGIVISIIESTPSPENRQHDFLDRYRC